MKKSAKALLGAGALFFGSGLAMNTFVLTRASKKVSDFKKNIEEKNNPTDLTLPKEVLRAEGDAGRKGGCGGKGYPLCGKGRRWLHARCT